MLIVFNCRILPIEMVIWRYPVSIIFHNHKFIRLERAGKLPKGQGIEETRNIKLKKCGMSLLQAFQLITSLEKPHG